MNGTLAGLGWGAEESKPYSGDLPCRQRGIGWGKGRGGRGIPVRAFGWGRGWLEVVRQHEQKLRRGMCRVEMAD